MTKLSILFAAVFLSLLFLGSGYRARVNATLPCPTPGGCKGQCGYVGCGDKCHCRGGGCGDWTKVCTYCDPNDCSDIYGSGWEKGRCNGAGDCEERSFSCNCGNGPHYCHRTKKGPGPSDTPTPSKPPPPTNTPTPPPSPTPIQPTSIVELPLPSPGAFSGKAVDSTTKKAAQNWICLKTTPCATGGITCSGGDPKHRVQITTKTDTKLIPSKKTYIFECMQTDKGYRCTTGNTGLDKELLGAEHLPALSSTYGYKFIAFTNTAGKTITQSNEAEVLTATDKGDIGPVEWESYTTTQVGRIMMGMQSVDSGDNLAGQHGTQKLGTFIFGDQSNETKCVMIKWDPHGVVFDTDNSKPLGGVKVTLYRKGENGVFAVMGEGDVFGGVVNPQLTEDDGAFAFYVPDGTYKLAVSKEGYVATYSKFFLRNVTYESLYDGGEIVTNGKLELRNIGMRRENLFDILMRFIQGLKK